MRIEGVGQVLHVESKPAEPANLLSHIRRGGGDLFWVTGWPSLAMSAITAVRSATFESMTVFATRLGVFQLLFLLDGIAALDHGSAKADTVEEIIVGLDLGG
ncbi:MAG TPA: hypothetical protein VK638_09695, partial [Edaphobacter sp.]|nr:hypothetical protein [Edaphobacter sp.]